MRIAQVAPLCESTRMVSWLAEALVALGHHVTPMASVPDHRSDASAFDIIHFHTRELQLPMRRGRALPHITTVHGALDGLDAHPKMALVSVSMNQRLPAPRAGWVANVAPGLPLELHTLGDGGGGYLAYLGRIAHEGGECAVEITRRAGARLVTAGGSEIDGESTGEARSRFLGRAHALLFPSDREDPLGLVMIEAMACGTPVIAWRRGSVPEIIEDGVTGFIVDDIDEAAQAVRRCGDLDRARIRRCFTERFDAARMAREYVAAYETQLASAEVTSIPPIRRAV